MAHLAAVKPEGLFFGGLYPEAGRIVSQMRKAHFKTVFFSGDGAQTPSIFAVAGDAADGAYFTSLGVPFEQLPGAPAFMDAYRKRWNGADENIKPKDHFAYAAAQILFEALAASGPSDRAHLLESLRRVRHDGLLGSTSFDEKGDTADKTIAMTRARYKDRSFEIIGLSTKAD
jgi:branched-chain amino acid transport system substrate-binding protein